MTASVGACPRSQHARHAHQKLSGWSKSDLCFTLGITKDARLHKLVYSSTDAIVGLREVIAAGGDNTRSLTETEKLIGVLRTSSMS